MPGLMLSAPGCRCAVSKGWSRSLPPVTAETLSPLAVFVPRERERPRRAVLRHGTHRPREPYTGFLQDVPPVVTDDQLALVPFAVDLGAAVPVHDVGPECVGWRRVAHSPEDERGV